MDGTEATTRFITEQLSMAVTEVLDAKLTLVEARLKAQLSRSIQGMQLHQREERNEGVIESSAEVMSRIAAVETCLESLKGGVASMSQEEKEALCEGIVNRMKTTLNKELGKICGHRKLDALEERLGRLEENGNRQEQILPQETGNKKDMERPRVRQGIAMLLQLGDDYLTPNDAGWLCRRKSTRFYDGLVTLYICHHDGTYVIKSLKSGKSLQRQADGYLRFGDPNEEYPEHFYINAAGSNGKYTLRCAKASGPPLYVPPFCCPERCVGHRNDNFCSPPHALGKGELSILALQESGLVPKGLSNNGSIPIGVEIVLAGKHGFNLQNNDEGKAVCVDSRMYWERFVILPGGLANAYLLQSTKDGKFLQSHDSEVLFEKAAKQGLHIEAFPGGKLRLVFSETGNVVRTYSNHQVRCEDSTGGDWSRWTIVWRSDGVF